MWLPLQFHTQNFILTLQANILYLISSYMNEFFRRHLKGDPIIWMLYLILCFVSIVAVFSASSDAISGSGKATGLILKHIAFMAFGFGSLLVIYSLPMKLIKFFSFILLFFCIALLGYLLVAGSMYQGAARSLGGLFQPSEFVKFALIVVVAFFIDEFRDETFLNKFFYIFCLIVWITIGLIFPMNLSQAIIIFVPVLVMLIVGAVPWKKIAFFVGIPILGILLLTLIATAIPNNTDGGAANFLNKFRFDTWQGRFRNHIDIVDSWEKADNGAEKWKLIRNYDQVIYAKSAIYDGKIGVAPGNSVWRNRLQEVSKDFIYALIVEEYGLFLGGMGVIFLYLWLLWRGGVLIRKIDTVFQAVVIIGAVTLIVFQAFVHIAVNVGLLPVTGQTLPLISKGGTSIMVMGMLFGLILGMSRKIEEKNGSLSEQVAPSNNAPTTITAETPTPTPSIIEEHQYSVQTDDITPLFEQIETDKNDF